MNYSSATAMLVAVAVASFVGTAGGVCLGTIASIAAIRHLAKRFGFPL